MEWFANTYLGAGGTRAFVPFSSGDQQNWGLKKWPPAMRESLVFFLRTILWEYRSVRPLCRDLTSDQQIVGNSEKSSTQDSEAWFTGARWERTGLGCPQRWRQVGGCFARTRQHQAGRCPSLVWTRGLRLVSVPRGPFLLVHCSPLPGFPSMGVQSIASKSP